MGIFDSHAHYDDEAFSADREEVIRSLPAKGVSNVINAGASLESSYDSVSLASKYDHFYAAVGIHPEYADKVTESDLEKIKELLRKPKVVAVGEIGLDYHYEDGADKDTQRDVFIKQIEIALEYDLPIIVHDRDAHGDTLEILKKYKPRGVLHCFSGSAEFLDEIIKLGMYIGLGGAVTFKNAKKPKTAALNVPIDKLLLETDCPYMAPVPHRGQRCDSSMIVYPAREIAAIRGMDAETLISICADNTKKLFSIET